LIEREAELTEAQALARVGSWRWDPVSDRTVVSEELRRIYGIAEGTPFPNFQDQDGTLYPHDDWLRLDAEVRRSLETGEGYSLEVQALRGGVEPIWVHTRSEAVRGSEGRAVGLRGTVQDITERKRYEKALEEADRRKDEFLATLAHELRNPLAPLRNGLHLLRLTRSDPSKQVTIIDMMERQVAHTVRLVDDLMEVSRITRGRIALKREVVDLAGIARAAVESALPLLQSARVELTLELPSEPVMIDGDPVRLAQVLSNLLNNAAKYTDAGGRVRLTVACAHGEACVSVRDNGTGIPAEMLSRVFDLFTQVDRTLGRAQGGLGIGLALVKSLVELHGGRVEVSSEGPGRGSEFVVRLPLATPVAAVEARHADDGRTAEISGLASGQRIVVVDDNRDAADSLAAVIGLLGADVVIAYDGLAALDAARMHRPSMVFLDLGMPGMDGFAVATRLREDPQLDGLKLIALTGWGQEADVTRTRSAGFDHHLVKPVKPEIVVQLLAEDRNRAEGR
jgi:signal transduction histidine kinase/ActR/RegA family two-component response regulator